MTIKSAVTTEGMPITIIPYSPEALQQNADNGRLQDILLNRIGYFYNSHDYVKAHEQFKTYYNKIVNKDPELKKIMLEIDSAVVAKETEAFDEGYKAGMADLMTALTFNDLQITHTEIVDMKAIDERRREAE